MEILIADDHQMYRKGLHDLIQENHPEVSIVEAQDGQEVLTMVRRHQPDIILLDLEMPNLDGLDTIAFVRDKFPQIKIIVITMHEDQRFMDEAIEMGVHGYLLKGDDEGNLIQAIDAVRKGKAFFGYHPTEALQQEMVRNRRFRRNFRKFRQLSDRELQILQLICQEKTTRDIAEALSISARTVENHRNRLLEKCGTRNTAGLVIFAVRHNLIDMTAL